MRFKHNRVRLVIKRWVYVFFLLQEHAKHPREMVMPPRVTPNFCTGGRGGSAVFLFFSRMCQFAPLFRGGRSVLLSFTEVIIQLRECEREREQTCQCACYRRGTRNTAGEDPTRVPHPQREKGPAGDPSP